MKFLFFVPKWASDRTCDYCYSDMLTNGGFSGTDACILEQSYFLAKNGHHVVLLNTKEYEKDGIVFWNIDKLPEYDLRDFDVFSPFMFSDAAEVPKIVEKLPLSILYVSWFQCFPNVLSLPIMDLVHSKNIKQLFISPSDYVTNYFKENKYHSKAITIYNGLNESIFNIETVKERGPRTGNFIFPACFERGGLRSFKTFEKFYRDYQYGTFHIATYVKDDKMVQEVGRYPNVKVYGSLSKVGIRDLLCSMDYFVYYLALEDTRIHHDTYACCVHEALACGVIVFTWDVACLREIYGDNIILLKPPKCDGYNPAAAFGNNPNYLTNEAVDMMYAQVKYFEENPEEKDILRRKGQAWALQKTHYWKTQSLKFEALCKEYIKNNTICSNKDIDIVIARYNENVGWLNDVVDYLRERYTGEIRVFIYNKGDNGNNCLDDSKCKVFVEALPNIGRESHTYLYHVCKHYSEYSDDVKDRCVVFLQGSIQEHLDEFKIMCFKGCRDPCALVDAFVNDVSLSGSTMPFAKTHEFLGGNKAHYGFKIGVHNGSKLSSYESRTFGEWFKGVFVDRGFAVNREQSLIWWVAGLFALSNKVIVKNRNIEFYRYLLENILPGDVNPEVGHFFERSWVYVFGVDGGNVKTERDNHIVSARGKNGALL